MAAVKAASQRVLMLVQAASAMSTGGASNDLVNALHSARRALTEALDNVEAETAAINDLLV